MQQGWIQQLHHVLDFSIQLQHITLGQHICQHRQEVISSIQPPWVEGNTGSERQTTFFYQLPCLKGKHSFVPSLLSMSDLLQNLLKSPMCSKENSTWHSLYRRQAQSCPSNKHKAHDAHLEACKGDSEMGSPWQQLSW